MKYKPGVYTDYNNQTYKLKSYDNTISSLVKEEVFGKIFLKAIAAEDNKGALVPYPKDSTMLIPLSGITSLYEIKFNI